MNFEICFARSAGGDRKDRQGESFAATIVGSSAFVNALQTLDAKFI
jgi:hypothetical protein